MSAPRVLLIDDDAALRFALGKALARRGFQVSEAASGEAALELLRAESPPEVALLDLRMRGIDGLEVLRRLGGRGATRVLVLTGHGTVQAAVEAMRLGAFSFLEKPVDADVLEPLIRQALHSLRPAARGGETQLVGDGRSMQRVRAFVERIAPSDETVTIFGETGTGKEVVARELHVRSRRAGGPFVAMNAACVPRELFESELFGHRRGAFTGATADRPGLFREAQGGTLFIDELAELPLDSQAKLLRALEARAVRPVGESREVAVDARIVAATNRDLAVEVREGRFREDLFYRLQVFPIVLPPLRERLEDLPALSAHLLARVAVEPPTLTDDALHALSQYHWPGNVRELLNVLRRAALFAEDGRIDGALVVRMTSASVFGQEPARPPTVAVGTGPAPSGTTNLAEVERAHIEQVLTAMEGNVTRAAVALGIDRRTLQRKMKSYGLPEA